MDAVELEDTVFDIVFPARGILGFLPGAKGHRPRGGREFTQASDALRIHGFELQLVEEKRSEDEIELFHPAYLVRMVPIQPRDDESVYYVHRVTVEKLGLSEPVYVAKKRPQGTGEDIIEMPQVEMWLPFPDMLVRITVNKVWRMPDSDDD